MKAPRRLEGFFEFVVGAVAAQPRSSNVLSDTRGQFFGGASGRALVSLDFVTIISRTLSLAYRPQLGWLPLSAMPAKNKRGYSEPRWGVCGRKRYDYSAGRSVHGECCDPSCKAIGNATCRTSDNVEALGERT